MADQLAAKRKGKNEYHERIVVKNGTVQMSFPHTVDTDHCIQMTPEKARQWGWDLIHAAERAELSGPRRTT